MADRKDVEKRDGVFRTNRVNVEPSYILAPGYELLSFEQQEIGDTGRLKVLRVFPLDEQAAAPILLGRWDEKANTLDFDLVDRKDNVKAAKPYGHHSRPLGDRRFEVEVGPDANNIVFKGIVSIALGFRIRVEAGALAVTAFSGELIHGTGPGQIPPNRRDADHDCDRAPRQDPRAPGFRSPATRSSHRREDHAGTQLAPS